MMKVRKEKIGREGQERERREREEGALSDRCLQRTEQHSTQHSTT
jgi:hypothetical protein